jgi:hypothetical protein
MKLFFITLFIVISISCKKKEGTTTGNPVVNLAFAASSNSTAVVINFGNWLQGLFLPNAFAAAPTTITDAAAHSVNLDQGWIVVQEIEFQESEVAGAEEVDGSEIAFQGPFVVNLFSASPDLLGSVQLGKNIFRRIKMKLHALEGPQDSSPSELTNNSIYFHGTIAGIPFSLLSRDGSEIEIGGSNPISTHDNMNILISIRIVPLIAKIDFTDLVTGNSNVTISDSNKFQTPVNRCPSIDTSLTTLYDCFRKGLEQQANIGDDKDGDGEIESSEDSVK